MSVSGSPVEPVKMPGVPVRANPGAPAEVAEEPDQFIRAWSRSLWFPKSTPSGEDTSVSTKGGAIKEVPMDEKEKYRYQRQWWHLWQCWESDGPWNGSQASSKIPWEWSKTEKVENSMQGDILIPKKTTGRLENDQSLVSREKEQWLGNNSFHFVNCVSFLWEGG